MPHPYPHPYPYLYSPHPYPYPTIQVEHAMREIGVNTACLHGGMPQVRVRVTVTVTVTVMSTPTPAFYVVMLHAAREEIPSLTLALIGRGEAPSYR